MDDDTQDWTAEQILDEVYLRADAGKERSFRCEMEKRPKSRSTEKKAKRIDYGIS